MKELRQTAGNQLAVTAICTTECDSVHSHLVTTTYTSQNKTFNMKICLQNYRQFCSQLKTDFFSIFHTESPALDNSNFGNHC